MTLTFFAPGKPEPQGSSKAFAYFDKARGTHRAAVTHDNPKVLPWRSTVQYHAQLAMERAGVAGQITDGPVCLDLRFFIPAPKWAAKKILKGKAVPCLTRPDTSKLVRAFEDALTGLVFKDDSQVVGTYARKAYAPPGTQPGVQARIVTQDSEPAVTIAALPFDKTPVPLCPRCRAPQPCGCQDARNHAQEDAT
jgi:Holliday junction resolvase RusA-like endonuclease